MTRFDFATATRIVFGPGTLNEAGPAAKSFGSRALLVTGRSPARAAPLQKILDASAVSSTLFSAPEEPATGNIDKGVKLARDERCQIVISLGGGSVIDTGKAIAALMSNEGSLLDYLEVIGRGKSLEWSSAPFIAIPTTAGTGAEVTRNAVLASPEKGVKVSLRSPLMLPRLAIVDPELTSDLPPALTATTGMDALTQLIEAYVSVRANPLTDGLCLDGIARASRSMRHAFAGGNKSAREEMALAALFSGLALANAGLGAVHGFAAPIGGMFHAPHGAVCAALLPHVMEVNVRALRLREPASEKLARYEMVSRLLTASPHASIENGIAWIDDLCRDLSIPELRKFGIEEKDLPTLCERAALASSMKGNPIQLQREELAEILQRAL
jgi:alcohol dehydrogenase class IV